LEKPFLLHTLSEVFSGNSKRFKGLWIDKTDYDFSFHPVILLSLSVDSDAKYELKFELTANIKEITEKYDVNIDYMDKISKDNLPTIYFKNLIRKVSDKFDKKVMILIDEYDALVTGNMSDPEVAKVNAKILHNFFAFLKDLNISPLIRFTFVTGFTRYALTSMDL
jgi:hypothetical protein